jgi:hypothetical protein
MIEAMGRGWANRDASIFLTLQEDARTSRFACLLPERAFQPTASVKDRAAKWLTGLVN